MSYERKVMGAMLRLARKRMPATNPEVLLRAGGTDATLATALRKLEKEGVVERLSDDVSRLTMIGLALAVAFAPGRAKASPGAKPARKSKATKKAIVHAA